MVRLTRAGEYAIKAMLYLSKQPEGLTFIGDVAKSQGVSAGFLAKIFQELSRAGLVDSHRGAGGGVSLGMAADEITVKMIIEAVEGPIALNNCLLEHGYCRNRTDCPVADMWRDAQGAMVGVLERSTLAELVAREKAKSGVSDSGDRQQGDASGDGNGMGTGS